MENVLYMRFCWRRDVEGLKTTDLWLRLEFAEVLLEYKPNDWSLAKCSVGWLGGFKKRYRITYQMRTNKKTLPIGVRLPRMKKFHLWLQHDVQRRLPQRDPKYGHFGPELMFHMDQIPLPFVLESNRTLNGIGKPVFILMPKGSGLDKRQATIQLTIRAGGTQIVRVALIFRNKGIVLNDEERDVYRRLSSVMQVYFQPNAWADEEVMLSWLEQFHADTSHIGPLLLGMDNHGAQQTPRFRARMAELNILPAFTPPDCTDVVAPSDHHVGARLKKYISLFYHMDMEENRTRWCNPPGQGGLEAWERRVLMAKWTCAAWLIVSTQTDFLRTAFVSTGFLLAKDGSENDLIKVPGVPDYDFTSP
jgi:hypothetical protein